MIHAFAPAKLNCFLHITGKRADGYHLLQSLVVFLSTGDQLQAEEADRLSLTLQGPFGAALGEEEHNLVLRAAQKFQHYLSHPRGARITLHKSLPIGAGLGGGSADAAATLRMLCALWQLELSDRPLNPSPLEGGRSGGGSKDAERTVFIDTHSLYPHPNPPPVRGRKSLRKYNEILSEIALSLGSDVPACLAAMPCLLSGAGEIVTPIALEGDWHFVLVNPRMPLLSADVYRHWSSAFRQERQLPSRLSTHDFIALLLETANDLEPPAIQLMPEITGILRAIAAEPGCLLARMSGSGATCFGVFDNEEKARQAATHLAYKHPDWWVEYAGLYHR